MSSQRKWALRIEHILDAIEKIQRYTANLDEASFARDSLVVDAVIRNFQIIGEAVRNVPDDVQAKYPKIPWVLMMGTQHVIVHGYDAVRLDIIWQTIVDDLPPLVQPLRAVLRQAEIEDGGADGA